MRPSGWSLAQPSVDDHLGGEFEQPIAAEAVDESCDVVVVARSGRAQRASTLSAARSSGWSTASIHRDQWSKSAAVGEHLDEAVRPTARVDRDAPVVAGLGGVANEDAPILKDVA